jgi:hypothetical protein
MGIETDINEIQLYCNSDWVCKVLDSQAVLAVIFVSRNIDRLGCLFFLDSKATAVLFVPRSVVRLDSSLQIMFRPTIAQTGELGSRSLFISHPREARTDGSVWYNWGRDFSTTQSVLAQNDGRTIQHRESLHNSWQQRDAHILLLCALIRHTDRFWCVTINSLINLSPDQRRSLLLPTAHENLLQL